MLTFLYSTVKITYIIPTTFVGRDDATNIPTTVVGRIGIKGEGERDRDKTIVIKG